MRKLIIHALIVLSVFVASSALGSNADSLFNSAGNYYQNQDYDEALRLYLEIEQKKYESAELYFNIGNCFFKKGKLGYAILYYLRAQRLNPGDVDVETNLEFARMFMPTRMEGIEINPISTFFDIIVNSYTLNLIAWVASALFIILMLYLSAIMFMQWRGLIIRITVYIMIFLVLASSGLASYKYRVNYMTEKGVIVADETRILSGPGEDNDVEFVGVFGLIFEIEKETDNYYLVLFENKRKGWILIADVEKI
ncbi:MAG: tetratricopeptide repeat protein [candidate division Zixibacteria bacterium]|nr:tetratricopeptide repeat protein [candidate division Zixibacteria bacterium]